MLALSAFRMWPLVDVLACLLWSLCVISRDIFDRTVEIRRLRMTTRPTSRTSLVKLCLLLRETTAEYSTHWSRDSSGRGLQDGKVAQTTKQAQERWLRFHAATFFAQKHPVETDTTTCSDLDRDLLIDGFSTEVVRDILATLAPGKAAGEDLVANELLWSGRDEMAALLSGLFVKSAAECSVPQEWRGGTVRNIHKKRPTEDCSNSRGILTSSCVGKVCGRALSKRLHPAALNHAADTQRGECPGRSPEFASHCARLAARCKARGWSHATIFLDATAAFYSLMRPWVLGFNETEDCLRLLCAKVGIPTLMRWYPWRLVSRFSSLLAHLERESVALARDWHTGNWISVVCLARCLVSLRGQ